MSGTTNATNPASLAARSSSLQSEYTSFTNDVSHSTPVGQAAIPLFQEGIALGSKMQAYVLAWIAQYGPVPVGNDFFNGNPNEPPLFIPSVINGMQDYINSDQGYPGNQNDYSTALGEDQNDFNTVLNDIPPKTTLPPPSLNPGVVRFHQEFLSQVNQDQSLSPAAKTYVINALNQTFALSEYDPSTTAAEDVLVAYQNLSNQRQAGNSSLDLRDAQYYMGGYKLVFYNGIPASVAQYLPGVYDTIKGLLQTHGADQIVRNTPNNPTSPPGGAAAAVLGVSDAASLENTLFSQDLTPTSPLGTSSQQSLPDMASTGSSVDFSSEPSPVTAILLPSGTVISDSTNEPPATGVNTITGSKYDDLFVVQQGAGNWSINGDGGQDIIAVADLTHNQVTLTPTGSNSFTLSIPNSTVTATNVQHVEFTDGVMNISGTQETFAPASPINPLSVLDTTTGKSVSATGQAYPGPVTGLQEQYINTTADNINVDVSSPNWFLKSGPGEDALSVRDGSNVLDGGSGSNFLVGGTGADGGTDTFFTDARSNEVVWNTLVDFHAGDSATLWGFVPGTSSWSWDGLSGATGYTGATLRADVHGTTDASITFAGLSTAQAQGLQVSTGTAGGVPYLYVHSPSV